MNDRDHQLGREIGELSARVDALTQSVDRLADAQSASASASTASIAEIKETIAEQRGAGKLVKWVATIAIPTVGFVAGWLGSKVDQSPGGG